PAHPLASHAAVRRQNQPVRADVLGGSPYKRRHLLRPLDLQRMVVDGADGDLLALDRLADRLEVAAAGRAGLEGNYVGVALVVVAQRMAVGRRVGEDAL